MKVILCPECDQPIHNKTAPKAGIQACCPRCNYCFNQSHGNPETIIALCLTGLILCIPAFFSPLMDIKLLGNGHSDSLWGAAYALTQYKFYFVGILVALCSIIFPVLFLTLSSHISWCISRKKTTPLLIFNMKIFHHLEEWVMLDIYLLAIIISIIKLGDTAHLHLDVGFYSFLGLMLTCVIVQRLLPLYSYWDTIESFKLENFKNEQ